jgi:Zn-dependent peptidase ImmA (M78 family)
VNVSRFVPFLKEEAIEAQALSLLAECGQGTALPVPIDDIVERHLKLAIEYRDLRADYPEGDVLGCIWFNDKKIAIDLSLAPEDHPAMLGRYRFTLAHEMAHSRLHRHLYLHRSNQQSFFPSGQARLDHVLRSKQSDPLEFQDNRLASCLLMPREMVKRAWHEWRGGMEPMDLADLRAEAGDWGTDEMVLADAVRPLADLFQVFAEAMRIRLEEMGFLPRKREASLFVAPSLANLEDTGYGKE